MSFFKAIKCYDCGKMVDGSMKEHRSHCKKKALKCYDCNELVQGSIKDHHVVCLNNKKSKSTIDTTLTTSITNKDNDKYINSQNVYFILDVSGSMNGSKLNNAKESIKTIIKEINPNDRMAIITFDSQPYFKLKPRPVDQINRQNELAGILDNIFARGGTALYDAIKMGVEQLHDKSKKTVFNVLTDGQDNSSSIKYEDLQKLLSEYPNIIVNIIHIDDYGSSCNNYKQICDQNKGDYKVIKDANLVEEYILIFRKYYKNE